MSKKKKTNYLNLDKNQLVDKGKSKLQYEESCKDSIKKYSESKKHESDCKISKGTIKNISKKILTGTIILVLSTSTLTGCKAYGFEYKKNNDGSRYAVGSVDNNYIENCYYIEIYNEMFDDYESYIIVKQDNYDKINYLDIFTLDTLYVENDSKYSEVEITNIINIDEYLEEKDIDKNKYSAEYMKKLLEKISEESKNDAKTLVK